MRAVPITIKNQTFELCFSNRVLMRLEQEKLDAETTLGSLSMLSYMMEAGDKLARMEGREPHGFLSVDDLADTLGPDDLLALMKDMKRAQEGDRNVETVDTGKNGEDIPSEA